MLDENEHPFDRCVQLPRSTVGFRTVAEASRRRVEQVRATEAKLAVSAWQQGMRTLHNDAWKTKIRARAADVSQIVLEAMGSAEHGHRL